MLLTGSNYPQALAPLSSVLGASGKPFAMRTCLGWTVNGPVSGEGCAREPTTCSMKAKWQEPHWNAQDDMVLLLEQQVP